MREEEIEINVLEMASDFADKELRENWSETIEIYDDKEAGITHYTDEAQDIFNDLYKKWFNLIRSYKLR